MAVNNTINKLNSERRDDLKGHKNVVCGIREKRRHAQITVFNINLIFESKILYTFIFKGI